MNFHPEILQGSQSEILRELAPVIGRKGFYLGGGTAIALLLGHRLSQDFDWFTGNRLADPMLLAEGVREEGISFITGQIERGTLHGTVTGIRVTFLEYRYPLLQPALIWPEYQCPIASPADLACMKLSAVAQRGSRKDFLDIYALGRQCFSLAEMLELYREKYQVRDIGHVLYGLAYFDDADREPMPRCLWDLDWRDVKKSIRKWLKEMART